jgi:PAS domain S-box-containing protein
MQITTDSTAALTAIVDGTPDSIFLKDPQGRYLLVNSTCARFIGKTKEEIIGRSDWDLYPPETARQFVTADKQVLASGETRVFEGIATNLGVSQSFRVTKGVVRDSEGTVVGTFGISHDMTDRNRAEADRLTLAREHAAREQAEAAGQEKDRLLRELRDSEARLSLALRAAEAGYWYFDAGTSVGFWSAECWRLFGLEPQSEVGSLALWLSLIAPEDRQRCEEAARLAAEAHTELNVEYRIVHPEKGERWLVSVGNVVSTPEEKYARMTGVTLDVTKRKKAERELRETAERLRLAMETARMGDWSWSAATDQITLSVRAREILGIESESGVQWPDLRARFQADDRERSTLEATRAIAEHTDFDIEFRLPSGSGGWRWVSAKGRAIYQHGNHLTGMLGVVQDVTERKRAEEALTRYQLLSDRARDVMLFMGSDRQIVEANQAAVESYGYDHQTLLTMRIDDLRTPETRHLLESQVRAAYEGGVMFETVHKRRDGSTFPVESSGIGANIGGEHLIFCIIRDITERKRAEQSLASMAAIIESTDDAVVSTTLDGIITTWNPAAERTYGYTVSEALGSPVSIVTPAGLTGELQEILDSLRSGHQVEHLETVRIRKDGTLLDVSVTISPIRDEAGEIVGASTVARDITERKRAERERELLLMREQSARHQAEEANRLKDEFLATLSHELRTPLTAIIGWAHMLTTSQMDDSSTRHGIRIIERNAHAQKQLIEDVLDVSRIITGKLTVETERVDLLAVVYAAMDSVRPAADAKMIALSCTFDPLSVDVYGDAARLQQVVWNLLSNAVKFTPEGGTVKVEIDRVDTRTRIIVRDSGKGIAPEFLPFVFDRFRQGDGSITRQHGGLGLGLSIVRQLVEAHGGAVHAESAGLGHGSTFTVELPVAAGSFPTIVKPSSGTSEVGVDAQVSSTSVAAAASTPLKGMSILLIDDDLDALEMLVVFLRQNGGQITAVASVAEAYRALQHLRPDVIVSDIGMPDEDGYEFIRKVRSLSVEQGGQTPAIALTAYAGENDQAEAFRAGYQRYLAKPTEPGELMETIIAFASNK